MHVVPLCCTCMVTILMQGTCMEYAWYVHAWIVHGAWCMYDTCLDYAWNVHRTCMEYA